MQRRTISVAKQTDYNWGAPSLLELKQSTHGREIWVEFGSDGDLELTIEITNYGEYSVATEDRSVYLPRDEAIALAEFILEQAKESK